MFNLSSFIRSLFILGVIVVVLYTATKFSYPVKDNLGKVLGVSVSERSTKLPEHLQEEVHASVNEVTKKAMETDAKDIASLTSRFQKIVRDYQTAQKEIQKQVNGFFSSKQEEK